MDLDLTETQLEIRRTAARYLEKECPLDRVRATEARGFDPDLWADMTKLGLLPESSRDSGADEEQQLANLMMITEQQGRFLAPVPLVDVIATSRALDRLAEIPADDWLDKIRRGSRLIAVAWQPIVPGKPLLIGFGGAAEAVIGLAGDDLVVVRLADEPAARKVVTNLGSLPLVSCALEESPIVLAQGPAAQQLFGRMQDDWRVLISSALVGLSQEALDRTVDYVKERKAFGTPISSFQSVAHRLADVVTRIDGARYLCYEAAWAGDGGSDRAALLAAMTSAFSTETARLATDAALHLHGGVGYTLEQDIQLFFRRAKAWPLLLGDPRREFQAVAQEIAKGATN